MARFAHLFRHTKRRCRIIGMIHVWALPGTPMYKGSLSTIIDRACRECEVYLESGVDSILVENMHDLPYIQHSGPEITASMTRICTEVKRITGTRLPLGVQILAGCNKEALAVAKASSFDYIRAEGFVFGHIADEGYIDACAGSLLRYRKQIDAENVLVFTDIKKKHSSHSITNDVSLAQTAAAAKFFLSDGIILTGTATGVPPSANELRELKEQCDLPIIIGSGVGLDNFKAFCEADACIIGSHFKQVGKWENGVDSNRVRQFMNYVQ